MVRHSLLIFIILSETLQVMYCVSGNDSLNPFNTRPKRKAELKKSDLMEREGVITENNQGPSEGKVIEKRRLLFNEGEMNSPATTGRDFENGFSYRRQTNYTVTETDPQITEYQRGFNNWENSKQNMFPFPTESGNPRNLPDFRLRQPLIGHPNSNQDLNLKQKADIFGTEQTLWNGENSMKQSAVSESDHRVGNNYSGRIAQMTGDGDVKSNFYPGNNEELQNRRLSMATLNEEGIPGPRNYENGERVGDIKPDYLSHSGMNYYNRNPVGFWNPNFYRPEKGVIINFNTECPAPRQLNNQMVHKFIFTPKSSVTALPEISPFQIPDTAFISTNKRPSMYYL